MTTKLIITGLVLYIIGYFLGVNKQVEFTLPPAFPCHAEDCQKFYIYKTNYSRAFELCKAALEFQTFADKK